MSKFRQCKHLVWICVILLSYRDHIIALLRASGSLSLSPPDITRLFTSLNTRQPFCHNSLLRHPLFSSHPLIVSTNHISDSASKSSSNSSSSSMSEFWFNLKSLENSLAYGGVADNTTKWACADIINSLVEMIYSRKYFDRSLAQRCLDVVMRTDRGLWNRLTVHKMLHICFRFGFLSQVRQIFDSLSQYRDLEVVSKLLDTKAMVILVNGFTRSNAAIESARVIYDLHLKIVETIPIQPVERTILANAFLTALIKAGQEVMVESQYHLMETNYLVDDISLSIILSYHADRGDYKRFMSIWKQHAARISNSETLEINGRSRQSNARLICRCQMVKCLINKGLYEEAYSFALTHRQEHAIASVLLYGAASAQQDPAKLLEVLTHILSFSHSSSPSTMEDEDASSSTTLSSITTTSAVLERFYDNFLDAATCTAEQLEFNDPFASLLSGYLTANRPDLVIKTYLSAFDQRRDRRDSSLHADQVAKKAPAAVRRLDTICSVKVFNVFLAAVKATLALALAHSSDGVLDWHGSNSSPSPPSSSSSDIVATNVPTALGDFAVAVLLERMKSDPHAKNIPTSTSMSTSMSTSVSMSMVVDHYTIGTAMDIVNYFGNRQLAVDLWNHHLNSLSRGTDPNHQIMCSYLRSFTSGLHLEELRAFIPLSRVIYLMHGMSKSPSTGTGATVGSRSTRAIDEVINAYLRAGGLSDAMDVCNIIIAGGGTGRGSNWNWNNNNNNNRNSYRDNDNDKGKESEREGGDYEASKPKRQYIPRQETSPTSSSGQQQQQQQWPQASSRNNVAYSQSSSSNSNGNSKYITFNNAPITNMLIYFDRYWRDYNSESSWDHFVTRENSGSLINNVNTNTKKQQQPLPSKQQFLRNIFLETRNLCRILKRKQLLSSSDPYGYEKDISKWAAIAAVLISRGLWIETLAVLLVIENHYTEVMQSLSSASKQPHSAASSSDDVFLESPSKLTAVGLRLAIFSALEGKYPLLTATAWELHGSMSNSLHGISAMLSRIPEQYQLKSGSKRTMCSIGDVIELLEVCTDSNGMMHESLALLGASLELSPSVNYKNWKVPISVSLLQGLFMEAISIGKYKEAARIIRVLEKARIVIDIDQKLLISLLQESPTASHSSEGSLSSPLPRISSGPDAIRVRLAQSWAAQLVAKSLNKFGRDFTGSMKKLSPSPPV